MTSRLTFITGGARSGKSRHAETLAAAHPRPVVYLATMEPRDPELEARIARHRARRPEGWTTVEAPLDVAAALQTAPPAALVLLDCVSLWVSNLLFATLPDFEHAPTVDWERFVAGCDEHAQRLLQAHASRPGDLIAVSNEVGLGIVPDTPLGRYYRDALGLMNQRLAAAADEAILMVSGLPLRLR